MRSATYPNLIAYSSQSKTSLGLQSSAELLNPWVFGDQHAAIPAIRAI